MTLLDDLAGRTCRRSIYDSAIGRIEVEIEILLDGSISTTMWVVYPDGVGEEIFSIQEAQEKLEL